MTSWNPRTITALQRRLLKWFDQHQRELPWRTDKTPYRVWVSEIMLQQTQVATVIDYYTRFLKKFPTVKQLAAADEADVLKLWEGLGYYRRARQMHAAAKAIVEHHGGEFPVDFAAVLDLPGIGRYTAGAILSISQDQRLPILEGNTIRLFSRLLAMKTDPRSTANQRTLWEFAESILPKKRCGDFNQALMELGSEICNPKNPNCQRCPLLDCCPTFAGGWQSSIPVASKKMVYEDLHEAVVMVERKGKYLVRLCQPGERWAGMWDFPRFRVEPDDHRSLPDQLSLHLKKQFGLLVKVHATDQRIRHAVTKYRITLDCFVAESVAGRLKTKAQTVGWQTLAEIEALPMSITGRKFAQLLKPNSPAID
jgi:A/G-specific adenine glycosylase